MEMKSVIQITTESYIEEQYILEKFPEAVWVNLRGMTNFYLPASEEARIEVESVILEWKERNEK